MVFVTFRLLVYHFAFGQSVKEMKDAGGALGPKLVREVEALVRG